MKIEIGDAITGIEIRNRASGIQQKTNRPVQFEITADVQPALLASLERRGGSSSEYLFPSRADHAGHMSTRQKARLVDKWVMAIGLRKAENGTHSLRRTKAATIYRAPVTIQTIQILLGHTKVENTVRYLGVDVEDAWLLAKRIEIQPKERSLGRSDRPLPAYLTDALVDRDWGGKRMQGVSICCSVPGGCSVKCRDQSLPSRTISPWNTGPSATGL